MNEFKYLIEYFEQFPVLIRVVWILSGILFLIVLVLIVFLKNLRNRLRKNEEITIKYQKEYEANLITYLYSGNEEEEEGVSEEQRTIINQMKICIDDRFKRKIIVSILLKLKNEISGEIADSIQELYFETGLINFAKSKLNNKKWFVVAIGIRELTQFQVKEVYNEVIKHLNHPQKEVRNEVQLYLVNLFNFKGLEFLNDLATPLSEWDQIQLLEILQRFDNQEIPDINKWMRSKNESVVVFALKLAKIYNQFEVKDALLDLLAHTNKEIRIQAIEVLSYFQVLEAKNILKSNYNTSSEDEHIAFFQLLENTFESNDEPFILEHIKDENFEIQLSALKILKALNVEKLNSLKVADLDSKYSNIVNFVANN